MQQQEAAAAATSAAAAAGEQSDGEERVPPGCARYTVKVPKPLGMVLEEGPGGRGVYVVSGGSGRHCAWLAPARRLPIDPHHTRNLAISQAEVFPEGNAARLGPEISVGDELIATSGLTYTTQQVAPAAACSPLPVSPPLLCGTHSHLPLTTVADSAFPLLQKYQENMVQGGAALASPVPSLPCPAPPSSPLQCPLHMLARLHTLLRLPSQALSIWPPCCSRRGDLCAPQCAQQRLQNGDGSDW